MKKIKTMRRGSRISSFSQFWPYYLGEHSKPATRWVHAAGTLTGVGTALWALGAGRYPWILAALAVGYAPAWISHFFIEGNKPATLRYPLWSFCADFKMAFLTLKSLLNKR
jgi:hypothetical protein